MTVAIPVVKPVVTGYGMNWMRWPSRATPIATSSRPAMKPAVSSPESPYLVTMGARITTNAAVGPGDLELAAPEQRHDRAGDDGRVEAVLRRRADGDGERHRERQRHDPDDHAGEHVGAQVAEAVALREDPLQGGRDRDAGNRRGGHQRREYQETSCPGSYRHVELSVGASLAMFAW